MRERPGRDVVAVEIVFRNVEGVDGTGGGRFVGGSWPCQFPFFGQCQ